MVKKYMTPEGTRDIIRDECSIKRSLQDSIESVLETWGYEEIITPSIEFYETFNWGVKSIKEEEVYKFFDNKGKILLLRPDMTIPIARVAATKFKDVSNILRFRYSSNVFRLNKSLGGRKNEYTDCGVELIGASDTSSDIEILKTALDVLNILDNFDYKLEIGDVNLFNSAVEDINLSIEEKSYLAELIDKKSLRGLEEYLKKLDIDEQYKMFFKRLPWLFGGKEILDEAKRYVCNEKMKKCIDNLQNISDRLEKLGDESAVTFDLGMVPNLNYYTGIIFKAYVDGVGSTVLRGGRYDKLIGYFGEERPAIGFSVNLDSLLDILKDIKIDKKQYYNIYYNEKTEVECFKKAKELRKLGYIVNLEFDNKVKCLKIEEGGRH